MKTLKRKKLSKLAKSRVGVLRATRESARSEGFALAERSREGLVAQLRATGAAPQGVPESLSATTEALYDSATSAYIEIKQTTAQFLDGHTRSELRRCLVSLDLVASSEEHEDPGAPSGVTLDDFKREYAERDAREATP